MAEKVRVLLVDDDSDKLVNLKALIEASGAPEFEVHTFASPYLAFVWLREHPGSVEFAFIDHVFTGVLRPPNRPDLPSLKDGVEMAKEVSRLWPEIGVVLYSGDASITPANEWAGLAAGALRYVAVKSGADLVEVLSRGLLSEIRELREIKREMEVFHEGRRRIGTLQKALKVGIDVVDRRMKIWYANEDFLDICGDARHGNCFCCARFHNRAWPYCRGCLAVHALRRRRGTDADIPMDRIFYSPFHPNGERVFRYVHVWASPVYGKEDRPIAVTESVVDLTGSPTIEGMPIAEHAGLLLQAACEITADWLEPGSVPLSPDGLWSEPDARPGYRAARVYRVVPAVKVTRAQGLASYPARPDIQHLSFTLKRAPSPGTMHEAHAVPIPPGEIWDYADYKEMAFDWGIPKRPLVYALFDADGAITGWMEVDPDDGAGNDRDASEQDKKCLQPHADEIASVLSRKRDKTSASAAEAARTIEAVQAKIVLAQTAEEALQIATDEVVGNLGIEMGHIRLKRGNDLVMVAGRGVYHEKGKKIIPLSDASSLSARAVRSGQPVVINDASDIRAIDSRPSLTEEAAKATTDVQARAIFPLEAYGEVLGTLALQSNQKNIFTGEMILFCTRLAQIASYVLHDMTLREAVEKETEKVWREAAAAFAHRIGNILPSAQYRCDMIRQTPSAPASVREDAEVAYAGIGHALKTAAEFRRHCRRVSLSCTRRNLADVGSELAAFCADNWRDTAIEFKWPEVCDIPLDVDIGTMKDVCATLVNDSRRFFRRSLGELRIRFAADVEEQLGTRCVTILYEDNGPGVPAELKERIFDAFFTTRKDGTGIGLTDARAVIVKHGGSIKELGTASEGLRGVRFRIVLPVATEANPKEA